MGLGLGKDERWKRLFKFLGGKKLNMWKKAKTYFFSFFRADTELWVEVTQKQKC